MNFDSEIGFSFPPNPHNLVTFPDDPVCCIPKIKYLIQQILWDFVGLSWHRRSDEV